MTTRPEPAPPQGLYSERTQARVGPGAPLVACIHGSMDRHASFARLRARLAPTCDVLLYDRRGYAASRDLQPPAAGIEDHVVDLLALLEGRAGLLFGHSLGGDIALAFAQRHADLVTAVVVYEPPTPWLDFWYAPGADNDPPSWQAPTAEEAAEGFLRRMIGPRRYERIPAATRAELAKDGPALITELTSIRRDPAPFVPSLVGVPVVVAWGSDAVERHRRAAEWLVNSLPDPTAVVLDGAGHNAHRTHSKEIAELILTAAGVEKEVPGLATDDSARRAASR